MSKRCPIASFTVRMARCRFSIKLFQRARTEPKVLLLSGNKSPVGTSMGWRYDRKWQQKISENKGPIGHKNRSPYCQTPTAPVDDPVACYSWPHHLDKFANPQRDFPPSEWNCTHQPWRQWPCENKVILGILGKYMRCSQNAWFSKRTWAKLVFATPNGFFHYFEIIFMA